MDSGQENQNINIQKHYLAYFQFCRLNFVKIFIINQDKERRTIWKEEHFYQGLRSYMEGW